MKHTAANNKKGYLFGVLAALTFAIYVLINRYVYVTYDVDAFNYTATFLISGGFFALIGLLASSSGKELKQLFSKSALPSGLNGIIAGIGLGLFVFGQGYTTAVNASILAASTAITTAIFSKFMLKDSFNSAQRMWFGTMFAGLYIAIVGLHAINLNKGDLIILGACFILGFTNTFSKILMRKHSSDFVADVRLVSGGLFFVIVGLVLSGSNFLITTAGLWPLVAGFFFWSTIRAFYSSIKYISPKDAIIFANSHPIITPLIGVFLLSEPYSWTKFLGSVIVIISIYFISKNSSKC